MRSRWWRVFFCNAWTSSTTKYELTVTLIARRDLRSTFFSSSCNFLLHAFINNGMKKKKKKKLKKFYFLIFLFFCPLFRLLTPFIPQCHSCIAFIFYFCFSWMNRLHNYYYSCLMIHLFFVFISFCFTMYKTRLHHSDQYHSRYAQSDDIICTINYNFFSFHLDCFVLFFFSYK